MSKATMKADELDIPVEAFGNSNASEVLRAWSIDGGLTVSLNPMAFADSSVWGILLVDVARHVSRALANEGVGSVPVIMNNILNMFEKELARPTDLGTTNKLQKN
jgi:Domain of unknown function (DUF5076)